MSKPTTKGQPTPFTVRQSTAGEVTAKQIGLALSCIAADALVIKDMANRCADQAPDVTAVNAYCTAIEAIAEKLSWVADTVCSGVVGAGGYGYGMAENPTELFMSPAFIKSGHELQGDAA